MIDWPTLLFGAACGLAGFFRGYRCGFYAGLLGTWEVAVQVRPR